MCANSPVAIIDPSGKTWDKTFKSVNGDLKRLMVGICALFYTKYKYMCNIGIERSIQFFEDIDGDAKPEFVRVAGEQLNNKIIASNIKDGQKVAESDLPFDLSKDGEIFPGDINADGKTDFFILEGYRDKNNPNKYLKLAISMGNSFQVKTTGILIQNLKRKKPKENNYHYDRAKYHFVTDFNGDGRADFVQVHPTINGANTMDVYLSKGTDLEKLEHKDAEGNIHPIRITSYGHEFHQFVDMDGDGLPEFLRVNVLNYENNNRNLLITFFDDTGRVNKEVMRNVIKESL